MNITALTAQKYGEYKAKTLNASNSSAFSNALNGALGFTKSAAEIKAASASETSQAQELNTSLRPCLSPFELYKIDRELWKLPTLDKLEQSMAAQTEFVHRTIQGTMQIPVGKNELIKLMEEMEKAAANGESLQSVLQKQIDKYSHYTSDGPIPDNGMNKDLFCIDAKTGEVKWVDAKINKSPDITMEDISRDDDIVWDLAYDLQQFMKYTFFKSKDDDPEEVAQILADIKARQASKNYDRFDNKGSGVIEEDDKSKPDEPEDLTDGFIRDIEEHRDELADKADKGTAVTGVEYDGYVYGEMERLMAGVKL